MKKPLQFRFAFALVAVIAPLASNAQTNFFTDNFANGSTIGLAIPANPTINSASYETVSSLAWSPTSSIAPHDLRFGIASSGGNVSEIQALFSTNPVALTAIGDYIQLTVVFTNFSGVFSGSAPNNTMGFGLFSSGQVAPLSGGLNGTEGTANVPGGVNGWQGYNVIVGPTGTSLHYEILTRPAQTSGTGNQDLISKGSSTKSYLGEATISPSTDPALTNPPSTNQCYTDVYTIALVGTNPSSLAITNSLYSGANTNTGTLLTQIGGIATNSTYLVSAFDGVAVGFYQKSTGPSNTVDLTSIQITGQSTPVVNPPTIAVQPSSVAVPSGAACDFNVSASGFNLTYQWHRNGTNLVDGGNISGSQSSMLVISPASAADVLSGANGYWVTVTGAGNLSINSTMANLSLTSAKTLEWTAANSQVWDLDTTANWQNPSLAPQTFNFGDNVTFDNFAGGGNVNLANSFLSASSVTVNSSLVYTFESTSGTGSFAGPGSLLYEGAAQLTLNQANTFTGGTVISNATAYLYLENYGGLGNGPVTFALAGGQMEIVPTGSATLGINGNLVVNDDFTVLVDPTGSFGAVFLGDLSGVPGKTLTINTGPANSGSAVTRVRAYGTNTTYDADLNLESSEILYAPYSASGIQTYNGVIFGPGAMMQKGIISYFNNQNTYSGGMNIAAGAIGLGVDSQGGHDSSVTSGPIGTGPLLLTIDSTTSTTGTGEVLASGGAHTIANSIQYPTGTNNLTLMVGGTNNITFSGTFTLNGNDGVTTNAITTRTLQVTNTAATTFSGPIEDSSGFGYALLKIGAGNLYLNGANTYTGATTNNSGTTNAPGLLAGSGSIAGPVFVQTNSSIGGGPAASIGTLTINNNLTLAGNGWFRLNKSLGQQNDQVSVSGSLANTGTGTITVTNLGPALAVGDTFTLFSKAVTGGAAMTVTGGGANWNNKLAVDGSISVSGLGPTLISQPTSRAVAQGSSVSLTVLASTSTGVTNFQWQFNTTNISSATSNVLTIANFQATNAGAYRVVVNDGSSSVTSSNVNLTLALAPVITTSPISGTTLIVKIPTQVGPTYVVQTTESLSNPNWQTATSYLGDGSTKPFTTSIVSPTQLFIRVLLQ